jgi:acetyltransferase-like isoleucine patch superfamily enzyme
MTAPEPTAASRRGPGTIRRRLGDRLRDRWTTIVLHAALTPHPPEAFGAFGRSVIVPPARISFPECIFIGDGVVIHEGVWLSIEPAFDDITPRLEIGDGVRVGRFCQISCVGEIVIEPEVIVSDRVQIGDSFHDYRDITLPATRQPMVRPRPVRIGAGALLAAGAIVLPGTSVGAGAYIADGAVARGVVPPGAVVAGNPGVIVDRLLPLRDGRSPALP